MKLLVLGGTDFVGRAVVEEALARGHDVTTFTRGSKQIPGARAIVGDRRGDLGVIEQPWDLVVDTWSWEPAAVAASADLLKNHAKHYVYISTRSVYDNPEKGATESWPTVDADPDATANNDYAVSKRGGELATERAFGNRSTILRPGLIFGPYENIGRLPWWLNRMKRGHEILAPEPRHEQVQYIDARDLAALALDSAPGVFDTVTATTMGELLDACHAATRSTGNLVWSDPEQILAAGIRPWMDLPAWLPPGDEFDGLRYAAADVPARSIGDTVADTWAWMQVETPTHRPDRPVLGLDPATEAAFLATRAQ
jgi:nucleoside-diphosphate-sugar epimerase